MNRFRIIIPFLGLFSASLAPALADEWDKETRITVNQPLQIADTILTKGKYVLRLVDSDSDRHVLSIFTADGIAVKAAIFGIPTYRRDPIGTTQLSLSDAEGDQPAILRSWFYPGDNVGLEFPAPNRAVVIGQTSDVSGKAPNISHIPDRPTSTP